MAATATVTGQMGPGLELEAIEFENVTNVEFDCERNVLHLTISGYVHHIAISDATAITATKDGSNYTFTIEGEPEADPETATVTT